MSEFEVAQDGFIISGDVIDFTRVRPWRGNPHNCPSDLDFYGYTEIDFVVTRIEEEETGIVKEGDDLTLPLGVDEDLLEETIIEEINKMGDDYE